MSNDSTRAFHCRPNIGPTIDVAGVLLGRWWLRLTTGSRRRRHAMQLRNLNDATLRDIGLSRSTINSAARGPNQPYRTNHHI